MSGWAGSTKGYKRIQELERAARILTQRIGVLKQEVPDLVQGEQWYRAKVFCADLEFFTNEVTMIEQELARWQGEHQWPVTTA